jgi:hypothetical protein
MKSPVLDAASSFLGAPRVRLCSGGIAAGTITLLAGLALGHAEVTLGALCASWLFFAGLAAGGVAFSAALRLVHAEWGKQIVPVAEAASAFLVPALGILVVIVGGARLWMPGLAAEGAATWLFLATRVLVSILVLIWAARRYLDSAHADAPSAMRDAVVYVLVYVVALTLWAIDLVMGLHDWAPSTVIPLLYFMGALLSAVAWSALVTALRPAAPAHARFDLAQVLFGLCIFWFYLIFSSFLPVWYANMPDETGQLLARWDGGFKPLTITVVIAIFFLPSALLLPGSAKRRSGRVALGAVSILAGLVGERFLLVLPSLDAGGVWPAIAGVGVTLGLLGAFMIAASARLGATAETVAT